MRKLSYHFAALLFYFVAKANFDNRKVIYTRDNQGSSFAGTLYIFDALSHCRENRYRNSKMSVLDFDNRYNAHKQRTLICLICVEIMHV